VSETIGLRRSFRTRRGEIHAGLPALPISWATRSFGRSVS